VSVTNLGFKRARIAVNRPPLNTNASAEDRTSHINEEKIEKDEMKLFIAASCMSSSHLGLTVEFVGLWLGEQAMVEGAYPFSYNFLHGRNIVVRVVLLTEIFISDASIFRT